MSYRIQRNPHPSAREEEREASSFVDHERCGSLDIKAIKDANSPTRSLPGLAARDAGTEIGWKLDGNSPAPPLAHPIGPGSLLPDGLEADWRALSARTGEDAGGTDDLADECHRCGAEVECYEERGTAWCLRCAPLRLAYRPTR